VVAETGTVIEWLAAPESLQLAKTYCVPTPTACGLETAMVCILPGRNPTATGAAEVTESIVTFKPAGEVWKVTGTVTPRLAEAALPVPPLVEETAPVVLLKVPPALAVTLTLKVHDALAARVAPVRLILPLAVVAVMAPPPHDPVSPLGVATVIPAGSESVNATPVNAALALGLLIVKVRLVKPPTGMLAAPNDFEIEGGAITVMDAFEVFPVPPLLEVA